jgi:hypothetical protein
MNKNKVMKIEIETSAKAVECANCILGQAIKAIEDNPKILEVLSLSNTDVKNAIAFRKSLLKSFLKK